MGSTLPLVTRSQVVSKEKEVLPQLFDFARLPSYFLPARGSERALRWLLAKNQEGRQRVQFDFPSCGARRIAESAKLLVDDVLQGYPVRQWVLLRV